MNIQQRLIDLKPNPSGEPPVAPAKPVKRQGLLKKRGWAISAVLLLLLAAGGGAWYWMSASSGPRPLIVTAMRGDVEDFVTALGTLQPNVSVDVGAQVTGQLKKLYVQPGDVVKEGQLLAEIDAPVFVAKVDADRALLMNYNSQRAEKESNLILAKIQSDRQMRLKAENATSQEAYDIAQANLRAAEAQIKVVSAQIEQTQSSLRANTAILGFTKIVAPTSGTVANIVAKQGQTLNANQTTPLIMTLANLTTMTVYTQVSEADVPRLKIGMEAFFTTLGNPNKRYTGKLRQILPTPTVVNNVVLYTALFDVENDGQLMAQMSAQVFFVSASAHDVVTVPMSAVQFTGQGGARGRPRPEDTEGVIVNETKGRPATVMVVKEDGSLESRNVTVGVTDRVTAAILSGLEEGEQVAASAARAGAAARPRGPNGGPGAGPGFGGFR